MADGRMNMLSALRKLTHRERFIVLLTALVLVGGLIYRIPYSLLEKSAAAHRITLENTEKEILSLSVQIADLKASEADIKAGRKSGIAGWDLVDQKGVILVLEGISGPRPPPP